MENTQNLKITTFNGEEGTFPLYQIKFTALVYGLGSKYFNALNGIAPYDGCTYSARQTGRTPMRTVDFAGDTPARSKGADQSQLSDGSTAEQKQAQAEQIVQDYHQISRKVYALLIGSLGEDPIKRIMNAGMVQGNGIGAWNLLCQEYQSNSSVNKRSLFSKLISIKMEGELSKLHDYTYEFRRIKSTLEGMGVKFDEQLLIAILLGGLAPSYRQIVNIMNADASTDLRQCYSKLRTFQETNGVDSQSEHHGLATHSATQSQDQSAQNQNRSALGPPKRRGIRNCFNCNTAHEGGEFKCTQPCRVCGSDNHVRYHCPERKRRNAADKARSNGSGQGNATQATGSDISQLTQQLQQMQSRLDALHGQHTQGNNAHLDWGLDDEPLNGQEGL